MENNNMYKVIVAGSINMDVVATAQRHPRPGETLPGKDIQFFPGGKGANQAVASARMGAATSLVGQVGRDIFGPQLLAFLRDQRVDLSLVQQVDSARTGTAVIVVAEDGENSIVVVPGANGCVTPMQVADVAVQKGDILVSQFEIPLETIASFFKRGRSLGATTILNPAPAMPGLEAVLPYVEVLVVNETELAFYSKRKIDGESNATTIADAARSLRRDGEQVVVVTLGSRGALTVVGAREIMTPGRKVKAVDTTGAGDCFVGALAAMLADGATLEAAIERANAAASVCVQRVGAGPSMPTLAEAQAALDTGR